jgi:hypothetical protein
MSGWWILGLAAVGALVGYGWGAFSERKPVPAHWPLAGRKVFTAHEQQVYSLLRAAFPELCVLSKLPLPRFMRLTVRTQAEYWFNLISPLYVTFAVCLPNGRVVAVIDCYGSGSGSRSAVTLKRQALRACNIRYLRIDDGVIPPMKALRAMVMGASDSAEAEAPQSRQHAELASAKQTLAATVRGRRSEREMWSRDSIVTKDSFLRPDSRSNPVSEQ